jgi:hypothetical protein
MEHQAEIVHLASPVFLGAHGAAADASTRPGAVRTSAPGWRRPAS